ncbi:MAG: type III pantothenate kinase [bacterium]
MKLSKVIAVDIGNTNVCIGLFVDGELEHRFRISTNRKATSDECYLWLKYMRPDKRWAVNARSIISSVVPSLTQAFSSALERLTGSESLIVGVELNLSIKVNYVPPSDVGADRLADAVACSTYYELPAVVIDLGTATTFNVISKDKVYLGGLIAPGIETSMANLFERAERLFPTDLEVTESMIGTNTIDAIRSGTLYLNVYGIEGVIDRIEEEIGSLASIILTGGLSDLISGLIKRRVLIDKDLTLKGLYEILKMNI